MKFLTFSLVLSIALASVTALAISLGRAFPDGARISFEAARRDDIDLYVLDVNRDLRVDLTPSPSQDFGGVWSRNRLAFFSDRTGEYQLYLLTLDDGVRRLDDHMIAPGYHPVWSPDGHSLAYEVSNGNDRVLYVLNVDQPAVPGVNPHVLADSRTDDRFPIWSPDGTQIAFVSWRDGSAEIFAADSAGDHLVSLTSQIPWSDSPSWSPDGAQIAFLAMPDHYRELYLMNRDGSSVRQLSHNQDWQDGFDWGTPVWSPDGQSILFQIAHGGAPQMIVINATDASSHPLVSAASPQVFYPPALWLPDDQHVVFALGTSSTSALYLVDADGSHLRALTSDDLVSILPTLWN